MLQTDEAPCAAPPIGSVDTAREQILARCFDLRAPRLIGAELEWLTSSGTGARPEAALLAELLGRHAPRTVAPRSPGEPLPGGSLVSVEPGGQIELSGAPLPSARAACAALGSDAEVLRALLARGGVRMLDGAVDGDRPPRRILPVARYAAMQRRFDRRGPLGAAMMCSTAAIHVSVDCGADRADAARRWRMLNAAGPALVAAFADSPAAPAVGRAGHGRWASQRMRTWLALDPGRTGFGAADPGAAHDPIDAYADWALGAPLLCVRREHGDWSLPGDVSFAEWIAGGPGAPGRAPTLDDLDYHLSTLFPPVRPCGHLEVRYLDAQPGGGWAVPLTAVDALARDLEATRCATGIAGETAGMWSRAARRGLADGPLRRAAAALAGLAAQALADRGDPAADALADTARRCECGVRPGAW